MPTLGIKQSSNLPIICLVGRVNVGKSTLFNRLIEEQKAIVSPIAGTTRTRNEGYINWRGKQCIALDTGGLTFDDEIFLEKEIIAQTSAAIDEADVIVFVTSAEGVLPQERELARIIQKRRKGKPVMLLVNKVDSVKDERNIDLSEWAPLAFGTPRIVSATNGRGIGDFLDELYTVFHRNKKQAKVFKEPLPEEAITVALIGKPNVGKSSLFNKLIGEDKVIVSDMPHTTRESYDTLLTYTHDVPGEEKKDYLVNFVDTAGVRRKNHVTGSLEREGVGKTLKAIERSQIILLVLDGSQSISSQDKQLGGMLERKSKSVVILINKWDLAEDNSDTKRQEVKKMIYSNFPHLKFAPILFVSGKTGYRIHDIFELLVQIWTARHTHIANRGLDKFVLDAVHHRLPTKGKGTRHPAILGMRQLNENPPIFEIFIKAKTSLHRSYVQFLENQLRERFNFVGTPIVIKMTKMKK